MVVRYLLTIFLLVIVTFSVGAVGEKKVEKKKKAVPAPMVVKGDPIIGKEKAESERCQECHSREGENAAFNEKTALLDGQHAEYIVKQMQDFRSGARKHDFMSMMAKSIEPKDVADIAAYFSVQEKIQSSGEVINEIGKNLFIKGDALRNILPCSSCHGVEGKGATVNGAVYPVLSGQRPGYLSKQLAEFRSGERTNDGVMNSITKLLTDAEIEGLSTYMANL